MVGSCPQPPPHPPAPSKSHVLKSSCLYDAIIVSSSCHGSMKDLEVVFSFIGVFFPFFAFLISASSAVKDDLIWWSDLIDNFRCPLVNLCVAWNSFNIYSYSSPNPLIQACHATELRGFYSHGSQWRRDPLLPNCEPHFPPHCSYRDPCFPLSVFPFTVMGNNPAYLMIALLLVTFGWRSLPTLYITLLPYQTPPSLPTDWGIFRQFGFIHLVFF